MRTYYVLLLTCTRGQSQGQGLGSQGQG